MKWNTGTSPELTQIYQNSLMVEASLLAAKQSFLTVFVINNPVFIKPTSKCSLKLMKVFTWLSVKVPSQVGCVTPGLIRCVWKAPDLLWQVTLLFLNEAAVWMCIMKGRHTLICLLPTWCMNVPVSLGLLHHRNIHAASPPSVSKWPEQSSDLLMHLQLRHFHSKAPFWFGDVSEGTTEQLLVFLVLQGDEPKNKGGARSTASQWLQLNITHEKEAFYMLTPFLPFGLD